MPEPAPPFRKRAASAGVAFSAAIAILASPTQALAQTADLPQRAQNMPATLVESPYWADKVAAGELPPVGERIPEIPLVVDLEARGREFGTQGGTLRTMVTRSKDVRQMVVYGYARLVGLDSDYSLKADILESFENERDRRFVFHLRPGHRWSDGSPFTSEDFRYFWEDVANNEELRPSGPPEFLRVDGAFPDVSFPDPHTVVFEWERPNPGFLQTLANASPPFIYRPAHVLRNFHASYAEEGELAAAIEEARVPSWAALHNKLDNMYKFDNPDLPTLQPWTNATSGKKSRHAFIRNPYYHRIDARGVQLPYIDVVEMEIVAPGLVAAKANAGETDLQGRGLDFRDASILRKGEKDNGGYRTRLWPTGVATQIAIYPNLNAKDDVWREALRDVRLRRALSLAVDRNAINKALYFGLAKPGSMTVLPGSAFHESANRDAWAAHDPEEAARLLDEAGFAVGPKGIRLLPDGREMELVVETAGERQEVENALQIVADDWSAVGIKLVMRPLDRDILRNRIYAGVSLAGVWYGWDNGMPQGYTSPDYLAPRYQEFFAWPKWGQHHQTGGNAGEPPDIPEAKRLMELAEAWEAAEAGEERERIWREMLAIHADQVFGIGTVSEVPQPVVVSNRLRNVPLEGIWAWEPGAHFGIHRMDEFFFVDASSGAGADAGTGTGAGTGSGSGAGSGSGSGAGSGAGTAAGSGSGSSSGAGSASGTDAASGSGSNANANEGGN